MDRKVIVLSVAGSDPSGGAGIQADIKAISALGGYAATAITAVTVQNTLGVSDVYSLPPDLIGKQMEAVLDDLQPDAVKIGMTGSAAVVREIVRVLRQYQMKQVVFDPVMVSTSGRRLMEEDAVEAVCEELFPVTTLVTPNLHEAELLIGKPVRTVEEMLVAGKTLSERYGCAFLIKGGHLAGEEMCDVLCDSEQVHYYKSPRIESGNLHGTGCTLSSAIATFMVQGCGLPDAVERAKHYTSAAIEAGRDLHIGHGNGPLWHFHGE
ncbi:MAG: bifunctional hydroxymethylpyrimidine kinase/phosphomethylpyrimidine kinase [Bacteroides sp.]|jgi:hydroxymethylpyrimidine/phosphomethylpyrimidine kinase|nr:bifunctional hydroxymethylpyrimidine kinase/phosphomethylpyrimidine kinase [Bacteroides sp.]